jgi:nitrogen fixation protein NifU and related proteins
MADTSHSSKRALYEQVILEHNRKPRNFGAMDGAHAKAEGLNPLCGDDITVYLKLDGDTIVDVSFDGRGCAISKASASVMTTLLKGKTKKESEALFVDFHHLVTSDPGAPYDEKALGKLAAFSGVREFPVRIKCATLAWHALLSAVDGAQEPVSTE